MTGQRLRNRVQLEDRLGCVLTQPGIIGIRVCISGMYSLSGALAASSLHSLRFQLPKSHNLEQDQCERTRANMRLSTHGNTWTQIGRGEDRVLGRKQKAVSQRLAIASHASHSRSAREHSLNVFSADPLFNCRCRERVAPSPRVAAKRNIGVRVQTGTAN